MKALNFLLFPISLCILTQNERLVEHLISIGTLKTEKVQQIMKVVDRGYFATTDAYEDHPSSIGWGATISAPHIHAYTLEIAKDHINLGSHVLDVGSGTGYLTVCFALLAGHKGKVIGVEHIPALVDLGKRNTRKFVEECSGLNPLIGRLGCHVKYVLGDGRKGYPDSAPYDFINVGAMADTIPNALKEQLSIGGALLIPARDYYRIIKRVAEDRWVETTTMAVRFVPLTDADKQLGRQ